MTLPVGALVQAPPLGPAVGSGRGCVHSAMLAGAGAGFAAAGKGSLAAPRMSACLSVCAANSGLNLEGWW